MNQRRWVVDCDWRDWGLALTVDKYEGFPWRLFIQIGPVWFDVVSHVEDEVQCVAVNYSR